MILPFLGMMNDMADLMAVLALAVMAITVVVHLSLAVGVWADAQVMRNEHQRLYFIGAAMWGLVTLITGLLGATAYWLMHRSTLRRD